jgi:hypothetical protein
MSSVFFRGFAAWDWESRVSVGSQGRWFHFELRDVNAKPNRPTTAATIPPMSIQMALSVGAPVKSLERSELNDLVA